MGGEKTGRLRGKDLGNRHWRGVNLDMVEVRQNMQTLYGIYLTEPWKPGKQQEEETATPELAEKKRRKRSKVEPISSESDPAIRHLMVQEKIYCNNRSETAVSEIRLSGLWMKKLGFKAGMRVKITAHDRKLLIEIPDPDP